ncbi:aminotransferase class IV [Candidatus Kaiserbacteria bacterium]|nr:aminotransferase class IV [Candidatus Kaiserbacteria bacterium]
MAGQQFFNGSLVPEEQIVISPRDVGFARGFAVFDFLKTYPHHRPFKLKEHIDRLFNSAEAISLQMPWSKEQVTEWVMQTLAANESADEKFIKIFVSGGISNSMMPGEKPTIVILVDPVAKYPPEWYTEGTGVLLDKHDRYKPSAKTNNYIEGMKQTYLASKIGALEPIYYSDAQVYEGSNSNVFAVIGGKLLTPKTNILAGITRQTLLEILKLDTPPLVQDFTLDELWSASEVFMTGSGREVVPVTKMDGKPVGDGKVGPVTKEVMRQFKEYTLSDKW